MAFGGGYLLSIILTLTGVCPGLVDFQPIADARWISPFWKIGEFFTVPEFNLQAIALLAPIALVTFMEHIGDVTTNGSVVGKDFLEDPGLHKTLIGDGLATMAAGYWVVLPIPLIPKIPVFWLLPKLYDTVVLKIAAVFAICLGLFGKVGAVILCIPDAVKGGMSVVLFGMIAAVGMRTITEAQLDFAHSRNLLITGLILVFGLGLSSGISFGDFQISGLFVAVVVGVLRTNYCRWKNNIKSKKLCR